MDTVAIVTFLGAVLALGIGLVRPKLVLPRSSTPTRGRVLKIYGMISVIAFIAIGAFVDEVESGQEIDEPSVTRISSDDDADVDPWSTCEVIWAKISNADLRGDRSREAALKELARAYECAGRPSTIPHQKYPDAEELHDPPMPEYAIGSYRQSFLACGDSARIFAEAGSRDPSDAAEWYSTLTVSDSALVRGGYLGCLHALTGVPSRHPRE